MARQTPGGSGPARLKLAWRIDAPCAGPRAADYDVAIVGASTAGCTAVRLFAERGARVALIAQGE
ncbi:MAG TPA: hypothetical protein VN817_04840 [Solirubrobacteraceae bacterium]|nr:hypothetical protein [Solirubrobacteraceae bacterium]